MNEKRSLYIVTKPLQYINAHNIKDEQKKDLVIIPYFNNAQWFIDNIVPESERWNNIYKANSRNQILFKILLKNKNKYNKIYIDSDFGIFMNILFLFLRPIQIFIYEEGWSNYQLISIKKSQLNRFKHYIGKIFFHWPNYMGGSFFTKGIIVYHPDILHKCIPIHIKKKIVAFNESFINNLKNLPGISKYEKRIDLSLLEEKKILIFLSSWPNIGYQKFKQKMPFIPKDFITILKLHPHIKEHVDFENDFDYILDNDIPVEIFLSLIIDRCNEILIIHNNSSLRMYFSQEKIIYYNISNYPIDDFFDEFFH